MKIGLFSRMRIAARVLLGHPVIFGCHIVNYGTGMYFRLGSDVSLLGNAFSRPQYTGPIDPARRVDIGLAIAHIMIGDSLPSEPAGAAALVC